MPTVCDKKKRLTLTSGLFYFFAIKKQGRSPVFKRFRQTSC
ncbi:hypothetical protein HMPREF0201_01326 [Cedecea davisae DSM 4568]|uniref:Uncharacterized protein n=1 Tax=Cedecea davisae DSM 4568 TaxID=566551 RepID=S3J1X8_9ENTR|nr:hypothetical protein HMPREF0201_01326 [Cedecea davisae DSM 4568]